MPARPLSFLAFSFSLALWSTGAAAQVGGAALVAPAGPGLETVPARPSLPDFRMPSGDYRAPPGPIRNGLIGALPLGPNLQLAVGRFAVPEIARPRTHMEADPRPADIRRRDRGIAAVGFAFSF